MQGALAVADDKRDFWTDERCEKLRRLVSDGDSYAVIARYFGVTRNSISGKVMRLGIGGTRPHPIRTARRHRKSRKSVQRASRSAVVRSPVLETQPIEQRTVVENAGHALTVFRNNRLTDFKIAPVTWIEESSSTIACWDCFEPETMCAWPVRSHPTQYCGARRSHKSSYCERHREQGKKRDQKAKSV